MPGGTQGDRTAPQLKAALKLAKTTRSNAAAGKTTLKRSARAALRKGQKLMLTVQARDAVGNVAKRTATAKVR